VNWTQQGSPVAITMASTVYAGLAVTSHDASTACMAAFDSVTIPGWTNWTLPPAPADLSAIAGSTQVALSWTAPTNSTSYNVKRATTNGGPYSIIANIGATNYTDIGLTNGTTYYYVVSALNPAGESANSIQASATPQISATNSPQLDLTMTGTNLMLSWPSTNADFTLQSRTNLTQGDWVNVPPPGPLIVSNRWQQIVPLSSNAGSMFFRLSK